METFSFNEEIMQGSRTASYARRLQTQDLADTTTATLGNSENKVSLTKDSPRDLPKFKSSRDKTVNSSIYNKSVEVGVMAGDQWVNVRPNSLYELYDKEENEVISLDSLPEFYQTVSGHRAVRYLETCGGHVTEIDRGQFVLREVNDEELAKDLDKLQCQMEMQGQGRKVLLLTNGETGRRKSNNTMGVVKAGTRFLTHDMNNQNQKGAVKLAKAVARLVTQRKNIAAAQASSRPATKTSVSRSNSVNFKKSRSKTGAPSTKITSRPNVNGSFARDIITSDRTSTGMYVSAALSGFQVFYNDSLTASNQVLLPGQSMSGSQYTEQKVCSLRITYKPNISPYVSLSGTITLVWVPNAVEDPPVDENDLSTFSFQARGTPWQSFSLDIPASDWFYTGNNSGGTEAPNNLAHGRFLIVTNVSAAHTSMGYLTIESVFQFKGARRLLATASAPTFFSQQNMNAKFRTCDGNGNKVEAGWEGEGIMAVRERSGALSSAAIIYDGVNNAFKINMDPSKFRVGDVIGVTLLAGSTGGATRSFNEVKWAEKGPNGTGDWPAAFNGRTSTTSPTTVGIAPFNWCPFGSTSDSLAGSIAPNHSPMLEVSGSQTSTSHLTHFTTRCVVTDTNSTFTQLVIPNVVTYTPAVLSEFPQSTWGWILTVSVVGYDQSTALKIANQRRGPEVTSTWNEYLEREGPPAGILRPEQRAAEEQELNSGQQDDTGSVRSLSSRHSHSSWVQGNPTFRGNGKFVSNAVRFANEGGKSKVRRDIEAKKESDPNLLRKEADARVGKARALEAKAKKAKAKADKAAETAAKARAEATNASAESQKHGQQLASEPAPLSTALADVKLKESEETLKNLEDRKKSERAAVRQRKVCTYCGKMGHESSFCRLKRRNLKLCVACGSSGHMSHECPNPDKGFTGPTLPVCSHCGKGKHWVKDCPSMKLSLKPTIFMGNGPKAGTKLKILPREFAGSDGGEPDDDPETVDDDGDSSLSSDEGSSTGSPGDVQPDGEFDPDEEQIIEALVEASAPTLWKDYINGSCSFKFSALFGGSQPFGHFVNSSGLLNRPALRKKLVDNMMDANGLRGVLQIDQGCDPVCGAATIWLGSGSKFKDGGLNQMLRWAFEVAHGLGWGQVGFPALSAAVMNSDWDVISRACSTSVGRGDIMIELAGQRDCNLVVITVEGVELISQKIQNLINDGLDPSPEADLVSSQGEDDWGTILSAAILCSDSADVRGRWIFVLFNEEESHYSLLVPQHASYEEGSKLFDNSFLVVRDSDFEEFKMKVKPPIGWSPASIGYPLSTFFPQEDKFIQLEMRCYERTCFADDPHRPPRARYESVSEQTTDIHVQILKCASMEKVEFVVNRTLLEAYVDMLGVIETKDGSIDAAKAVLARSTNSNISTNSRQSYKLIPSFLKLLGDENLKVSASQKFSNDLSGQRERPLRTVYLNGPCNYLLWRCLFVVLLTHFYSEYFRRNTKLLRIPAFLIVYWIITYLWNYPRTGYVGPITVQRSWTGPHFRSWKPYFYRLGSSEGFVDSTTSSGDFARSPNPIMEGNGVRSLLEFASKRSKTHKPDSKVEPICFVRRGQQVIEGDDMVVTSLTNVSPRDLLDLQFSCSMFLMSRLGIPYLSREYDEKGYPHGDCLKFLSKILHTTTGVNLKRTKQLFLIRMKAISYWLSFGDHPIIWAACRYVFERTADIVPFKGWERYVDQFKEEHLVPVSTFVPPDVKVPLARRLIIAKGSDDIGSVPIWAQIEVEERILAGDFTFCDYLTSSPNYSLLLGTRHLLSTSHEPKHVVYNKDHSDLVWLLRNPKTGKGAELVYDPPDEPPVPGDGSTYVFSELDLNYDNSKMSKAVSNSKRGVGNGLIRVLSKSRRIRTGSRRLAAAAPLAVLSGSDGDLGFGAYSSLSPLTTAIAIFSRQCSKDKESETYREEHPEKLPTTKFVATMIPRLENLVLSCSDQLSELTEADIFESFLERYTKIKSRKWAEQTLLKYVEFTDGQMSENEKFRYLSRQTFTKDETNDKPASFGGRNFTVARPRAIMMMSPPQIITGLCVVYLIEVFNQVAGVRFQKKTDSPDEFKERITKLMFDGPVVTSLDISSFESSIDPRIKKLERFTLLRMCEIAKFERTRQSLLQRWKFDMVEMSVSGLTFGVETRLSGDFETSFGNGVVMYCLQEHLRDLSERRSQLNGSHGEVTETDDFVRICLLSCFLGYCLKRVWDSVTSPYVLLIFCSGDDQLNGSHGEWTGTDDVIMSGLVRLGRLLIYWLACLLVPPGNRYEAVYLCSNVCDPVCVQIIPWDVYIENPRYVNFLERPTDDHFHSPEDKCDKEKLLDSLEYLDETPEARTYRMWVYDELNIFD